MSVYGFFTFCAVYFVAVATPGPGVAAVLAQGLARGGRGGLPFIGGFLVGDLTWFLAAALGLSALAQSAHIVFVFVKYAGVAYLLYLAYKLWSSPARPLPEIHDEAAGQSAAKLFVGSKRRNSIDLSCRGFPPTTCLRLGRSAPWNKTTLSGVLLTDVGQPANCSHNPRVVYQ